MWPDRRCVHPGRQRKSRVQADIRVSRLEVFLHEQFQDELGNLDAIQGDRIHVNQTFSLGAVRVGGNYRVMQSAENGEQRVVGILARFQLIEINP